MDLKSRFADELSKAREEKESLEAKKEVIEKRLERLDCFLDVADAALREDLLEQQKNIHGPEVKKSSCCWPDAECFILSRSVDVGVIFDANMVWKRHLVCFTCRSATRLG